MFRILKYNSLFKRKAFVCFGWWFGNIVKFSLKKNHPLPPAKRETKTARGGEAICVWLFVERFLSAFEMTGREYLPLPPLEGDKDRQRRIAMKFGI